jgi:anti-sigma regulatory factor (Ser/Thr protein kinase)
MSYAGQLELSGGVSDARLARHWLGKWLASHQVDPDGIDTATLLVSELVSNAVIHARTVITICATLDHKRVRVDVTDGDPTRGPAVLRAADDAEQGRGIGILEALAAAWGTDRSATSKTVWFEIDCS